MKRPILSYMYRTVRAHTLRQVYKRQDREGKPRDLEDAIEIGDRWLKRLPQWAYAFQIPDGIGARIHDLEFDSPLVLSSFKGDLEIISIWMRLGLGGACIKTVMQDDRQGNPRPRIQECRYHGSDGLINALGLPGHGVESTIQAIKSSRVLDLNRPIGMSIGGSSLKEYKNNFDRLNTYLNSYFYIRHFFEVNISCPNTPDGQNMLKNPRLLEELLRYMRSNTESVISVKLSPDMSDQSLLEFAAMVNRYPKTAVNLGNTQRKTCIEVGLREGAISVGAGGLSGPALYPRTLVMTTLVAPLGIPIIATGGIDSAQKARQLLDAGASLIGMATEVVKDMYCIPLINHELAAMAYQKR